MSRVKLKGFSELEKKLEGLPGKVAKRASNRAMRAAGNQVKNAIAAEAPRASGGLADSVRLTLRNRNLTGLAEYRETMSAGGSIVEARGALRAARKGGASEGTRVLVRVAVNAPHAHLVEFGTVERFHKSGKSVGIMPANPFIRRAWDTEGTSALGTIKTVLASEIARAAKES